MRIEKVTDPNQLNIRDLILDEPIDARRLDAPFDPRLDLTEQDELEIENVLKIKDTPKINRYIYYRDIIFSYKREFDPGPKSLILGTIVGPLMNETNYSIAAELKVRHPFAGVNYGKPDVEDKWQQALAYINERFLPDHTYIENVGHIQILLPQKMADFSLDLTKFEHYHKSSDLSLQKTFLMSDEIDILSEIHAEVRLASPHQFLGVSHMDKKFWRLAREALLQFRERKEILRFIKLVSSLTLIAAEDIMITPSEFRVVLPNLPLETEKSKPLPVVREF